MNRLDSVPRSLVAIRQTVSGSALALALAMVAIFLGIGQALTPVFAQESPPSSPTRVRAEVVATNGLYVFDEPDATSFSTQRLSPGQAITVIEETKLGWYAIVPPPKSFCWIDVNTIEEMVDGRGRVIVEYTGIRSGCEQARLPGAVRLVAHKGDFVKLLERKPLRLNQPGGVVRSWLAIEPPREDVRYVQIEGVRLLGKPTASALRSETELEGERESESGKPSRIRQAKTVEPIDSETVRAQAQIKSEKVAKNPQRKSPSPRTKVDRGSSSYVGFLHLSSKQTSDGRKVMALVDQDTGGLIAYVHSMSGYRPDRVVNRLARVEGTARYDEELRAQLIEADDLTPLD